LRFLRDWGLGFTPNGSLSQLVAVEQVAMDKGVFPLTRFTGQIDSSSKN
jgi:hypothetical protein